MASGVRARAAASAEPERFGGRYTVETALGRGGMGAVYRVRDDATGARLALKRMTWSDAEASLRFRREFHTMASLKHPLIVSVFDYGIDGDAPYYTMELLDGRDLADLEQVAAPRACELLRDVAAALGFLHARRLLHRDLAPRNVRCTSDGRAKLIDFGVLATIGISGDVAGTPPFMAPEGVRGRPLDHRYDLYGLGALAYRMLTGRHAFPARSVDQLETAWANRPSPPSSIVADIPPALDELVLSLLAQEPLARPADAAEVIDRLTAIGGLDRAPEVDTGRGWLASAALVGRQREMAQIKRAAIRAQHGDGRSLLVEAPSGTGKSRLLRELALEAQLAGLRVVRTDSDAAGRGPYSIFHELARELIAAAPDEALAAARPRAAILARVIVELRERLDVTPAKPFGDLAEDRMRLQDELASWVLDIANALPIALLVDDVQRCDEASAAVLAALAHRAGGHKLLLGVALRTDETVRAPVALASIADAGQRLRLRGLDRDELAELCRSWFGNVPHIPRLARWMHDTAGGSPLLANELVRHLVERGVIRHVDGLWSIPEDPRCDDLPHGLAEAMDARIRALPESARALGEALSVNRGDLPLPLIVQLADTRDEAAVFDALDALAFHEILIQSGDSWRFRHDGLREALARCLTDGRRRALHRRVGEALLVFDDRDRDAEIGWHLLHGGDAERGAVRLERAGRALYDTQSFADCIAPLEAALDVATENRASASHRLELAHMLLMAGCMADRKTAFRHAETCIAGFRYWAGIDVATRARKLVGKHLGVMIGFAWAFVRWLVSPRRGPNPYRAFVTFFIVIGYTTSAHAASFDLPATLATVRLVEPVAILKNRIPYAAYLLCANLYRFLHGEFAIAVEQARRVIEIVERDRLTPITDIDRRTGEGGARILLVMAGTINLSPMREAELEGLARLQLKFYDVGAEQIRMVYHRLRGEEEQAAAIEARLETLFAQLGPVWMVQAFVPALSTIGYGIARDTLGLRRMIEELAALTAAGMAYAPYVKLARGEYLRERGDATSSLAELESITYDDDPFVECAVLPALAETLLVLGAHARARAVAERLVALASPEPTFNLHAKMRGLRTLALVDAATGELAAAAKRLETALAEAAPYDSPLLSGTLHEARARVALAARDSLAFHLHLAQTERCFRRTRNPALVARFERLAETGATRAPSTPGEDVATVGPARPDGAALAAESVTSPPSRELSAVLSGCRGSAERATRALDMIVAEARGVSGYLYLQRSSGLELVAPAFGVEPSIELVRALETAIAHGGPDTVVEIPCAALDEPAWKPIVLAPADGAAVGGIAVIGGALPLVDPRPELVAQLARELFEAGDVSVIDRRV